MITREQLRSARALLDFSTTVVAGHIGVSAKTISNFEAGSGPASGVRLPDLQLFYENRGVEFLDHSGVRLKPSGHRHYKGVAEFRQFYDDLYAHAKEPGGEIALYNAASDLVIPALGEEFVAMQAARMVKIRENFTYRVIFAEGDDMFFGDSYCEYRWVPKKFFREGVAIFLFGGKTAFALFAENDVEVFVLENTAITDLQFIQFNYFWSIASPVGSDAPD